MTPPAILSQNRKKPIFPFCPILSRLGELLSTTKNAPPGGPPGAPRGAPPLKMAIHTGNRYWGDPLRGGSGTPSGTPPGGPPGRGPPGRNFRPRGISPPRGPPRDPPRDPPPEGGLGGPPDGGPEGSGGQKWQFWRCPVIPRQSRISPFSTHLLEACQCDRSVPSRLKIGASPRSRTTESLVKLARLRLLTGVALRLEAARYVT